MRIAQMIIGGLVLVVGILLLLAVNRFVTFIALDIAGIALVLSGLLFWLPGLAWRQSVPWLTALFIPGSLAFAAGAIVMFFGRMGLYSSWYLLVLLPIALALAFLAMYYWGPRVQALWLTGIILGGISLFLLAVLMTVLGPVTEMRVIGSVLLIGLGLAVLFGAVLPRKSSTSIVKT